MENNPYQTPSTPSDQMEMVSELKPSTAFRVGSVFYCEPDFEAPKVCFKTGVAVPNQRQKSTLWCAKSSVDLYFDPVYLKRLGRKQGVMLIMVSALALVSVYFAMVFSNTFFLMPVLIMFFYALKPAKGKGIKIHPVSNGFFSIEGGHPEFLKSFPERDDAGSF